MDSLFNSKRRIVTCSENGMMNEQEATTGAIMNSGVDLSKASIDGAILISTDAATKITEKAISIAFDNWASKILTVDGSLKRPQGFENDDHETKRKKSVPTIQNQPESKQITPGSVVESKKKSIGTKSGNQSKKSNEKKT